MLKRVKKSKTRQFAVHFSIGKDDEIISKLDSVSKKTEYVRGLIKADFEHGKR